MKTLSRRSQARRFVTTTFPFVCIGVMSSMGCDGDPKKGSSGTSSSSSGSMGGAGGEGADGSGGMMVSSSSSGVGGKGGMGGMGGMGGTGGMATGGTGGSGGTSCTGAEVDCGGQCIDLTNHAENCGACGRSCLGGTCSGGICPITDVVKSINPAKLVKVDSNSIFYTMPSDIYQLPKVGGTPLQINQQVNGLAFGAAKMALDTNKVYWTCGFTPNSGFVLKGSKYLAGQTQLYDQLGGMGKPYPLAPGNMDANGSAAAIYWCAGGDGMSNPFVVKTGTGALSSQVLGTMQSKFCGGITLDATHAYTTAPDTGEVYTTPLAGGPSTVLEKGFVSPGEIVSDTENLYIIANGAYQNGGYPDGKIIRIPIAGGAPVELATSIPNIYGIAIDKTTVYFTSSWTLNAMTADGKVLAVAKTGGAIRTYATQEALPSGIDVDDTHVYWANYGLPGQGGTIRKTAK